MCFAPSAATLTRGPELVKSGEQSLNQAGRGDLSQEHGSVWPRECCRGLFAIDPLSRPRPLTCGRNRWRCALFDPGPLLFLGVSTAVRLIAGFVLLKYLALQFGPGSFGLLTQVMGVAAIFYTFAGGGTTTGLIRNISLARSKQEHHRWMSTGATINVLSSVALAGLAIALAFFGGGALFGEPSYNWAYIIIAMTQAVVGIGNVALAYLTAIGHIRTFAAVHITGNIASLLILLFLVSILGFNGALFGLVFAPAITGFIALWQFHRRGGHLNMLHMSWERSRLKNLFSYTAAMACGATSIPLAHLLIRINMGESLGWSSVGYWQAVVKLSDAYMLFVGVIFINYLLPRLSQQHDDEIAIGALARFGLSALGVFCLAGIAIYIVRDYLLIFIYSKAFLPATDLVLQQLTGDAMRIAALLLYYYFMSRNCILILIVLDVTQCVALYVSYLLLVPFYGMEAPVYGHILTSLLVLVLALSLMTIRRN
jgi:O-antigen/teichoic acid export membrane protein